MQTPKTPHARRTRAQHARSGPCETQRSRAFACVAGRACVRARGPRPDPLHAPARAAPEDTARGAGAGAPAHDAAAGRPARACPGQPPAARMWRPATLVCPRRDAPTRRRAGTRGPAQASCRLLYAHRLAQGPAPKGGPHQGRGEQCAPAHVARPLRHAMSLPLGAASKGLTPLSRGRGLAGAGAKSCECAASRGGGGGPRPSGHLVAAAAPERALHRSRHALACAGPTLGHVLCAPRPSPAAPAALWPGTDAHTRNESASRCCNA